MYLEVQQNSKPRSAADDTTSSGVNLALKHGLCLSEQAAEWTNYWTDHEK